MTEEIPDKRFKEEMMRMMDMAIQKFGVIDTRLKNIESDVGTLKSEQVIISAKLDDSLSKIIDLIQRMEKVESHIKSLDDRVTALEKQTQKIIVELSNLRKTIKDDAETRERISKLNTRVEKLEEKVFA